MSQAALAASMRDEGWKWSQPTVAAVEKGERGLKLAEAESLVGILGLEQIEDLIERPASAVMSAALGKMNRAADELLDASLAFYDAQFALASALDELHGRGELAETPDDGGEFAKWLRADPATHVTAVAAPFIPLRPEVVSAVTGAGPWTRYLSAGPYGERSQSVNLD
ncbi:hypothetical protein SAMN05880568_3467 [Microbacterium sp. RURRCA19A]|nr:hypothetical protein SAMN05880568_3467 [Microbacterium sp. RURRCA19A]